MERSAEHTMEIDIRVNEIIARMHLYEKVVEKLLRSASLTPKQEKELEEAYNIIEACDNELDALGYYHTG